MTQALYEQGLAFSQAGKYQEAINVFNEAISASPYWADLYYRRGLAYYDLGKLYDAVSDYSKAIELDKEQSEYYYARSIVRLALKNIPSASEDIEQAIVYNRDYAPAYQLKGIIYRKGGQNQQAIASFKQAADLYLNQQNTEACRRCLAQIKELQSPTPPSTPVPTPSPVPIISPNEYYTQLITRAELGDGWGAIKELDWVLKVDPHDGNALCCRGVIYSKLGQLALALNDLSQAIKVNDQDIIAYRNRGKIRSQLGDYGGAISDFNFALKVNSQDAMLYLARGDNYAATGNYEMALSDYSQGIAIDTNYPDAYQKRAQIHIRREEVSEAIADYQQAANLYLEKSQWTEYEKVVTQLKKLQQKSPINQTFHEPVNPLRQRLLQLVGGQWAIAEALIDRTRAIYPGMSEDWYIEKVVYDIEHDRNN